MDKSSSVSFRRSWAFLAAVLAVASACGKKKDEGRAGKLSPPAAPSDSALVDDVARQPSAPLPEQPREVLPAWASESPHFFNRGGRRFASAIGWASGGNPALARAAAEDRARVDLLRLIKGGAAGGPLQGALPGARMTDSFASKQGGKVFVRVEIRAAR